MIIELDSVELYFNQRRILNGVYLKAETGKIVGLLGRNGSGKSCLLQILFGSIQPKYKFIKIDGTPVLQPLFTKKHSVYLPQHQLTPNNLSVSKIFKMLQLDWQDFVTHFEAFSHYYKSKINALSGGERRVLETYAVLKQASRVVLLDEPFSNIAPLYVEKIKRLIVSEKKHKAIIITDHYFKDVIDICDTLYLLKNGCTQKIKDLNDLETYNYLNPGRL